MNCNLLTLWSQSSEQEKADFLRVINSKPKRAADPTALEKIIFAAETQQIKQDRKRKV